MSENVVTLTEFLMQRWDELDRPERHWSRCGARTGGECSCAGTWGEFNRYVLADIQAKRAILEYHGSEMLGRCQEDGLVFPCRTVRALAQPYADRPSFREEWRV